MFAQLTINGKWEGPHVFVVRIRNDDGSPVPGVTIRDNGPKMGLNVSPCCQDTSKSGIIMSPSFVVQQL